MRTVGRIGLAIAPSQTNTVYACVIGTNGLLAGMYRSLNAGDSWTKVSGATLTVTGTSAAASPAASQSAGATRRITSEFAI